MELTPGRRVRVTELGEDPMQALERFIVLEDQPAPDPDALGPHDVVIRVRSSSVGWVDLIMASGQYQHVPPVPWTPGLEYAGTVAWTGKDVDPAVAKPGDEVTADGGMTGPRSVGDYQQYGGMATWAVAPDYAVRPLPDGFTHDQGCNLYGSYETAYHCLVACGNVQPGETVLIHGASGATGLAAVHTAKILGATVIATGRSDDKLAMIAEQGADHTINVTPQDGEEGTHRFRDEVKALTGGKGGGADVVYDSVGGAISLESLRCVKFGARFLIVGWAATPFVAQGKGRRGAPNANMLPTNLIMMKGLKVLGCPTFIATLNNPALRVERLEAIHRWVREGVLRPHVSHTWELADFKDALRGKWNAATIGGCAIRP